MITVIEPDDRDKVEAAIRAADAEVLPFNVEAEGLSVAAA